MLLNVWCLMCVSNASIAYFCFFFCLFSDLEILYFFRKCVMRPLPYNSENMDCWKSLPIVRKELMLDHCWKFKNDHWFQEKLNLCTILVRKQIATIAQLELLGNTPLNQHGNCSCLSKLWFCGGGFFFYLTLRRLCKCLLKWPCEIIGVYEQANGAFFIVVHWHLIQATAVSLKTFVESQFGIMRPITLITFLCVVSFPSTGSVTVVFLLDALESSAALWLHLWADIAS